MPDIHQLLTQKENSTLEFKRTIESPGRIAKTLVAFANTAGGTLVVGVEDDRTVRGVQSEKDEVQRLENASQFWVDPPLTVRYEAVRVAERSVLVVQIAESDTKPHKAKTSRGQWEIYVRSRDKSVPAGKTMGNLMQENAQADSALLASPNVRRILQFLQKTDRITPARAAALLNMSEYRAAKLLRELTRQGVLLFLEKQSPKSYSLRRG